LLLRFFFLAMLVMTSKMNKTHILYLVFDRCRTLWISLYSYVPVFVVVACSCLHENMNFVLTFLFWFACLSTEAGKQVFTLFKNRGWEAIIPDDLIGNVLFLVSLIVGGIVGVIGIVIERTSDLFAQAGGNATGIAFLLGFVIGLVICSIALSTIASAVNAIIVLFAEAPADFARNYPELSRKMTQIWSEIYPGSV
jgi:Plasma-membrane choline transporter